MAMKTWLQYVSLILIIGVFVYTGIRFVHQKAAVQVGEQAPLFELESISGERVNLAKYKGQPVVLNFFTTWCGPCIDELPELEKYQKKYGGQVPLLVIDRREPKERVSSFAEQHQSGLLFLLDYKDEVSKAYGIKGQPETMIIDGNGEVKRYIVGGMTADELAQEVMQYTESALKP